MNERNRDSNHRRLNSEAKKRWWDSEKGIRAKEEMRSGQYKRRLSEQALRAWKDDNYRRVRSGQSRDQCRDDDFIECLRDSSSECWKNEEYRKKVSLGIEKAKPLMLSPVRPDHAFKVQSLLVMS